MPPQLTGDRWPSEGTEGNPDRRVEAFDGLEHAQSGDLQQVVDRFTAASEAHRFAASEVEVHLDQPIAQPLIAGSLVLTKRLERLLRLSFHW